MTDFDTCGRSIVQAAMAGDFSQRVRSEGKDGVLRNLAAALNTMCDNLGKAFDDVVRMLGSLSEGDLTQRITAEYQGAFAMLKQNANKTAERINATIAEIGAATQEVNNAAAEISTQRAISRSAPRSRRQALSRPPPTMEEMSGTVKKNAENAGKRASPPPRRRRWRTAAVRWSRARSKPWERSRARRARFRRSSW